MLFKNFNDPNLDYSINEGNFISSDITTIFDTDAGFRLSELTIDKLFEGLDIEKSEAMHNFIKTQIPSLESVMGKSKSSGTMAFEIIRNQIRYMETQIMSFERDLSEGFAEVKRAMETQGITGSVKKVSKITSPSGIASVIPNIDKVVKEAKKENYADFSSPSLRESFLSLYNINILDKIKQSIESLEGSSNSVGLKGLYTVIDNIDLQKIESDSADAAFPQLLIGAIYDNNKMIESTSVYNRFASFFEQVITKFPFGATLQEKFGKNYSNMKSDGYVYVPSAISTLQLFNRNSNLDISAFQPLAELLDNVSYILIKRVFSEEHKRNIFTPALQVMFLCMIVHLALKLINLNIEVEVAGIKKEEAIKKDALLKEKQKKIEKRQKFVAMADELESLQFFNPSGVVYRLGSTRMSTQVIRLVNNLLVNMGYLQENKIDDMNYDQTTADAVLQFQTEENLRLKDGKIGKETKGALTKFIIKVKDQLKKDLETLSQSSVTGTTT